MSTTQPLPPWDRPSSELTAADYAAIHLRVPESNQDWLNDMIYRARWLDACEKAMQAYLVGQIDMTTADVSPTAEEAVAEIAVQFAEALIQECHKATEFAGRTP